MENNTIIVALEKKNEEASRKVTARRAGDPHLHT
jgi:hypothetical protein